MIGVINQTLLLHFIVVFLYGSVARQVQINGNITEKIGTNGTKLACNFTLDQGDRLVSVWILATNMTLRDFENVASFDPDFGSKLQQFGKVLFGNASLSSVNKSSKSVSLSFDDLNCKHSRLYKYKLLVKTVDYPSITTESEAIGISIQVPPSTPDDIWLANLQNNSAFGITDGDSVPFVCTGDVGNPHGKLIFQKYRRGHILPMNYTATSTSIREISDNCSYYRTSYITFQVTADDNHAVIRCAVVSPLTERSLYVESEPLHVYFNDPQVNRNTDVIVVGIVCGSVILVLCVLLFGVKQKKTKCILMRNRSHRSLEYVNGIQQQDLSLYESVGNVFDVHHYEQPSTGEHSYTNTNLSGSVGHDLEEHYNEQPSTGEHQYTNTNLSSSVGDALDVHHNEQPSTGEHQYTNTNLSGSVGDALEENRYEQPSTGEHPYTNTNLSGSVGHDLEEHHNEQTSTGEHQYTNTNLSGSVGRALNEHHYEQASTGEHPYTNTNLSGSVGNALDERHYEQPSTGELPFTNTNLSGSVDHALDERHYEQPSTGEPPFTNTNLSGSVGHALDEHHYEQPSTGELPFTNTNLSGSVGHALDERHYEQP